MKDVIASEQSERGDPANIAGLRRRLCLLAMTVMFTACAPKEQPYVEKPLKSPSVKADIFEAGDGVLLPFKSWLPGGKPKAVIVALHGFNDYSNAFKAAGKLLSKKQIAVYAYDQRGFGKTAHTGIWAGERNYTSDLKQWVEYLSEKYPHTPIYILGESMGGAVAITAVSQPDFPPVDGLILVAPAVWGGDTINPLYRLSVLVSAYTFPYYKVTGQGLKIQASDNIEMLREMGKDPLVQKATRIDAIYGVINLMDAAYGQIPNVPGRVLFLFGDKDQVIPPAAMAEALTHFTSEVSCRRYPQAYHMLLRDLNGAQKVADIGLWIQKQAKSWPVTDCIR